MPPTPPRSSSRPPRGRAPEKKKGSSLGKIIVLVVVLLLAGVGLFVAGKVTPTIELEKQMDAAAEALTLESVASLSGAIDKHEKAVNRNDAVKLGNEIIALQIKNAASTANYHSLEKIEEQLKTNADLKQFNTEENRDLVAAGWKQLLAQMAREIQSLESFRTLAERLRTAPTPAEADIRQLVEFKLPVSFSPETQRINNAAYAAAIVSKNQNLIASLLESAANPEEMRAGTEETCKDCAGLGTVACASCTRNPGKCPACNAKGTLTAATGAKGKNFTTTEIACKRCEGTGNCTACKGTGKRECFQCKGTGKRPNSDLARLTMQEALETLVAKADVRNAEYKLLREKYLK